MDYLQIRDDRKLNENKIRCISQLKSLLTNQDTYTVLAIPYYDNIIQTVNASDKLRFEWLAEHENGVYVDDDCYLFRRFVPLDNKQCWFPLNNILPHPDIFLVYVNGNKDFIHKNFNFARKKKILDALSEYNRRRFYGWPVQLMRELKNFSIVPPCIYVHAFETMRSLLHERNMEQQKKHSKAIYIK